MLSDPAYDVHRTEAGLEQLLALSVAASEPWAAASVIGWGGPPYRTWFRALWDERGLYLRFDAEDAHPWHTLERRDDPLWEEEVVEIFLDPDNRGHHYAELEISPANVVCDVRMLAPWPNRAMDLAWDLADLETRAGVWPSADDAGAEPLVAGVRGGWSALARLTWESLASLPTTSSLPPRPGDRWKFNVFRIKRPGGSLAPNEAVILAAWSPTDGPSFHVPAAFRDFVFRGAVGNR